MHGRGEDKEVRPHLLRDRLQLVRIEQRPCAMHSLRVGEDHQLRSFHRGHHICRHVRLDPHHLLHNLGHAGILHRIEFLGTLQCIRMQLLRGHTVHLHHLVRDGSGRLHSLNCDMVGDCQAVHFLMRRVLKNALVFLRIAHADEKVVFHLAVILQPIGPDLRSHLDLLRDHRQHCCHSVALLLILCVHSVQVDIRDHHLVLPFYLHPQIRCVQLLELVHMDFGVGEFLRQIILDASPHFVHKFSKRKSLFIHTGLFLLTRFSYAYSSCSMGRPSPISMPSSSSSSSSWPGL